MVSQDEKYQTQRSFWTGIAGVMVLLGSLALSLHPIDYNICLFHKLTGMPCPGCGLTRSLIAIWQGYPIRSFRFQPLGIPLFSLCAISLAGLFAPRPIRNRLTAGLFTMRFLGSATITLFIIWIIRLTFHFVGNRFFLW